MNIIRLYIILFNFYFTLFLILKIKFNMNNNNKLLFYSFYAVIKINKVTKIISTRIKRNLITKDK